MQPLTNSYPEITNCNHSFCEHLWNPYCDEIPVWKTVAIIALTVLTGLIVPLAICYLITCCFNKKAESDQAKPSEDFVPQAVHTVQNNQGGQLGQNVPLMEGSSEKIIDDAFSFASEKFVAAGIILNQGDFKPHIDALIQLRLQAHEAFEAALKNKDWSNEEVLTAADEFMKLSYIIGLIILGTYRAGFTSQLHLYFPRFYREIRSAVQIEESNKRVYPKAEEITQFAQLFYQESRHQNWRLLYNDYCDKVPSIVTGQALADIASELQKDMGMEFVTHVS